MPLKEDAPLANSQFALDRDRTFLHKYTPEEAILIIDSIPDDSFHWPAIEWNRVEYYADYILKNKWQSFGQHWHPVRFNGEGVLLTGAQRILAVFLADRPMDAWTVDHSESWFRNGTFVGPPRFFPMNSDHHRDED